MVRTFALTRQTVLLEDLLFVVVSHTAPWAYLRMRISRESPCPHPFPFNMKKISILLTLRHSLS